MDYLKRHIEALVFCSPTPLKVEDLQNCLSEMFEADVPTEDIEQVLKQLKEKFQSDDFSFEAKSKADAKNAKVQEWENFVWKFICQCQ